MTISLHMTNGARAIITRNRRHIYCVTMFHPDGQGTTYAAYEYTRDFEETVAHAKCAMKNSFGDHPFHDD